MTQKITALRAQKRTRERVNVYLDEKYAFSLQAILAASLRVGQMLSPADIARLRERDSAESVYEKCLGYLSHRPRSQSEILQYLRRRQVPPETSSAVIARLVEAGLLDDQQFAAYWVENRESYRPRGIYSLRQELRSKGLSASAIDEAVQGVDEEKSALAAARGYARRLRQADRETFRRKLTGFLQRRGFKFETIRQTVECVWRETSMG